MKKPTVIRSSLQRSSLEGAFATMMASLAGGLFLVGFASEILEASEVQIGILAALPISANLAQMLGSIWLEKFGQRRKFCLATVTIGRLFWLPVLVLPFFMDSLGNDLIISLLILFIGISCLFGSLAGVAWLEWMSDLIPQRVRGTYMSRRNMVCAAFGVASIIAGGLFLDRWQAWRGGPDATGYMILFGAGLVCGLLASAFLVRIPDPHAGPPTEPKPFDLQVLLRPFHDRNFRKILFYVGAFMFVTQMAGPFYAVFMLEDLDIRFSTISLFLAFATVASLFMWRIWGPICDRLGNKPVLMVAGGAHALIPLIWITAVPEQAFLPLIAAHVASGMFYSAIQLGHVNILVKLSPREGRSAYIAAFNAVIGLSTALAPIVGGLLIAMANQWGWSGRFFGLASIPLLFLLSGALQVVILPMLSRVAEMKAASSSAVLMQLKNDLNPQTGIASASDFVLIKKTKTLNVLTQADRLTDGWLSRWEDVLGRAIDRMSQLSGRYFGRIHKWLKEDS